MMEFSPPFALRDYGAAVETRLWYPPRNMRAPFRSRSVIVFLLLFVAATAVLASTLEPHECDQPCGDSRCGDCVLCAAPAALASIPALPAIGVLHAVEPEASERLSSGWAPARDHVPLSSRA